MPRASRTAFLPVHLFSRRALLPACILPACDAPPTVPCQALLSFIYPFCWQGAYIPVLPKAMFWTLQSPIPFLGGVHASYLRDTPVKRRPAYVTFVDLDHDKVIDSSALAHGATHLLTPAHTRGVRVYWRSLSAGRPAPSLSAGRPRLSLLGSLTWPHWGRLTAAPITRPGFFSHPRFRRSTPLWTTAATRGA